MQLHQLVSPKGSRKRRTIVGRGIGSGLGKTSGRGSNGQASRSGERRLRSLEGGQTSLIKRIPKVGFRCPRPIFNQVVNLMSLNRFDDGAIVNAESLKAMKLISSLNKPIKILAKGEVTKKLIVEMRSISKIAQEKLEKAGCTVKILEFKTTNAKRDKKRNIK